MTEVLIVATAIAGALDAFISRVCVERYDMEETNPVVRVLLAKAPFPLVVLILAVATGGISWLCATYFGLGAQIIAFVWFLVPIVWNLRQISIAKRNQAAKTGA